MRLRQSGLAMVWVENMRRGGTMMLEIARRVAAK
jgi:hypothetical protein